MPSTIRAVAPPTLQPPRNLRGASARTSSALPGGVEALRSALAVELERARVAGRDVAGIGIDVHGHRVLVHRTPSGELRAVKRLTPFRWASPESV